jgi:hypothetical protein
MKTALLLCLLICTFTYSYAQSPVIAGQLTDKTGEPLIGASVVVLRPGDSSIVSTTTSDLDGNFTLTVTRPETYLLQVSYIGFEDLFLTRSVEGSVQLGKLVLRDKATTLKEVNVIGEVAPVQQKGDTTEINARAFKTNPDANAEDLVTKMPGITTQDGKVQAQGEDVQKVLVDGREFFGDDASAVLKNLPAEVIDKIQVFDRRSDQSELTGFDDGNTSKTINIVTKPQFRNGTFGKVFAGYGYEDKWRAGLNVNFFQDKRRITILANSNNINEQNFSADDLLGVMSSSSGQGGGAGGRGQGRRGGGGGRPGGQQSNDAGNFLVDQRNGITTTNSFGINYADQWKKMDVTGSYFLNHAQNRSVTNLYRQYITTQNNGLAYRENRENTSTNINHRFNMRFDWKIDSFNAILFQPRISIQQNSGTSILSGTNTESGINISTLSNRYTSDLLGINLSAPFNYRHSFNRRGRTFSINATPGFNSQSGNNNLSAYTFFMSDTLSDDSLNQLANLDVKGVTFSGNVVYTEPLSTKSQLMLNYRTNINQGESDKETFNRAADGSYTGFDTALSNMFNSRYVSQAFGANYRFQEQKWNVTVGVAYQYAELRGKQQFPSQFDIAKTFTGILPNAQFQYRFTSKENLRLNYRSSNNAPSVNQLQNVINNSNPLQLTTGNPDLRQDWQHNVTLRYSSSNTQKSRSFFALLSGTVTRDYIVNSTFIAPADSQIATGIVLARGSQLSRPVNLDGYYTVRSFNNYSFPIASLKSNLNVNAGGSYTRTPGLVNDELNFANSYNAGLGFTFSSNISERLDFMVSSNTTYNHISNTLQSSLNSDYYNQSSRFKIQAMPWGGLVLQTDLNHQYNTGLSGSFNQNFLLWNAAAGYKFLRDRRAELRLSVFDILKENNSITRNTTETYYEDVQTNVLRQYWLLTFTYNIRYYRQSN